MAGPEPVQPRDRRRIDTIAHVTGIARNGATLGNLQGGDPTPLVPPMVTLQMLGGLGKDPVPATCSAR